MVFPVIVGEYGLQPVTVDFLFLPNLVRKHFGSLRVLSSYLTYSKALEMNEEKTIALCLFLLIALNQVSGTCTAFFFFCNQPPV